MEDNFIVVKGKRGYRVFSKEPNSWIIDGHTFGSYKSEKVAQARANELNKKL